MLEQEPDYIKTYRVQNRLTDENPFKTGRNYSSEILDNSVNYNETQKFIESLPVIGNAKCFLGTLDLRRKLLNGDKFVDIWIPPKGYSAFSRGIFVFRKEGNGLHVETVCGDRTRHKGVFQALLYSYYVENFDYVTVSSANSKKDLPLWILQDKHAKSTIKTTVISSVTGRKCDIEDTEAYWNNPFDYIHYELKFEQIIIKND
jgi:hypothetical protein